ncbi:MAG: hypothetical protein KGY70_13890 [Bacteroidales bacterium]|nr:hypothetical protein [Bacteroidales bacterium]
MPQVRLNNSSVNTTLSDHMGVSSKHPNNKEIKQMLSSFIPMKGEIIYSQVFSTEQCVLSPWQSNLFGFRESICDINRVIDMVHPGDVDQVWNITRKAMDLIYSEYQETRRFIYRSTYRILYKGHSYIRILRETAPLLYDEKGKIIASVSRSTDITCMGHPKEIKGWLTFPDKTIDLTDDLNCKVSRREREILFYLAKGYSSKAISTHLNISKLTVDKHRANMLRKTNVSNTSELIHYAIDHGILE